MYDSNQGVAVATADYSSLVLQAWRGQLTLADLFHHTSQLEAARQHELACVLYQTWLEHNKTPLNHFVHFNLGTSLSTLEKLEDARQAYLRAIELSPAFVQPHFNLGLVYERLGNPSAAIAQWLWVANTVSAKDTENRPLQLSALNNLGRLLENERKYADALVYLQRSLEMEPNQPDVLHHWVFLRAKQCEWPVYAQVEGVDPELMRRSTSALAMIALSDDPQEQLTAAQNYVANKINCNVPTLAPAKPYGHKKIRVGYLSSDLCLHPVAMLTAELFELHNRDRFEVYGYCWSREDNSAMRKRIISSMDRFERIQGMSDEAAARLIREHEIDILVDLHGQTLGARAGILAYRPAPIQITYLGLPATTGFPFVDYVIADRFLIPEEYARFYSEKPLYMPDVYQVSDRQRVTGTPPSRESCNLPADGFVFCSFNNNYKFTPEVFGTWMRILNRVPGSVLWLLSDNEWAEANLRKEAEKLGVNGSRLIFAPRIAPENYLARFGAADLFLDTFPFNAGTTANDALWTGLPVLTRSGRSFASRMAGALLTAAELDELITYSPNDYEETAVALANAPERCRRIRDKLHQVRESGKLFDTPRFVGHLEDQFTQLVGALG
ncbi:O-linked N-acetylglucosamine transferase, SPINDLY family protein [Cupriavidus numazuensis]|uniref:protein O-GlcNAc transferase n=1 Tax=Cupriavidus numazuensis TaxID=221992 RepID=A0ABN7QCH0_9BURK|nr:tetratricopeptide repeat protein [Cupriavidus numazuensis]CAG2158701.1 hypothetical protein LMG26411_06132 [Cupriavidus numazuensis]